MSKFFQENNIDYIDEDDCVDVGELLCNISVLSALELVDVCKASGYEFVDSFLVTQFIGLFRFCASTLLKINDDDDDSFSFTFWKERCKTAEANGIPRDDASKFATNFLEIMANSCELCTVTFTSSQYEDANSLTNNPIYAVSKEVAEWVDGENDMLLIADISCAIASYIQVCSDTLAKL